MCRRVEPEGGDSCSRRVELRAMLALGGPSALVSALRTAQTLTDQAIIGHLAWHGHSTPIYLDAAALALLWMQLTITIATRGLGGAINVLTAQAIGAGNKRLGGCLGPNNFLIRHASVHDAYGYLRAQHGVGPGYNYCGRWRVLADTNPLAGQVSGLWF